jgi:LacI family transcriptional regulator
MRNNGNGTSEAKCSSAYIFETRNKTNRPGAEETVSNEKAAGRDLLRDIIWVIVPDINNPFFCDAIKGIEKIAHESGLHVMICDTDEKVENELNVLQILEREKAGGIIIAPVNSEAHENAELLLKMQRHGVQIVLMDRDIRMSNLDGVFLDNYKGAFDGVEALIKAGHTKIGLIAGPVTSKTGKDRLEGYIEALKVYNIEKNDAYIHFGDFLWQSGYEITARILAAENRPTAMFVSNNQMSLGCLRALQENNISVPGDIALLVFDDNMYFKTLNLNLSVVDRSPRQMGIEALNIMIEKLNTMKKSKKHVDKRIILLPQVILRGSELLTDR